MSRLTRRVRNLIMRAVGTGQIVDTVRDGFAVLGHRLDVADRDAAAWRRSCTERLDRLEASLAALDAQIGGQGRAQTEQGEAAQHALETLRGAVDGLRGTASTGQALAAIRVELSHLRSDMAREFERAEQADPGQT